MLDYAQIIADFVKFSPESKIEDYIDYLKFKSGFPEDEDPTRFYIKGTMIKYANLLRRYLHTLHHIEVPEVRIEYFKKPKNKPIKDNLSLSKAKIFDNYQLLSSNGKIEDAVLLYTIFALGVKPYQLYLFTFESIKEDKTIEYWDHKTRQMITLKLPNNLYGDILFLRNLKKHKGTIKDNEERWSLDGTKISETFIFKTSPEGVYNKFNQKFGGLLKNFKATPKELIQLSRKHQNNGIAILYT